MAAPEDVVQTPAEDCDPVLGDDHPDTLTLANNLAMDLREVDEYDQARQLNEDTLTRRRVLGDDQPDSGE